MAKPSLDKAEFPNKLHKTKGFKDAAKITGTTIQAGNAVKVVGTKGKKPTVWHGKIKQVGVGGVAVTEDLEVADEQVDNRDEREEDKTRGPEDVSVTVTNADGESQPVVAKMVPTIP